MRIRFTKMHGLGNDFVVIDGISQAPPLDPSSIRRLSDRHFGVGCDQVLVVERPKSAEADFRYRIFNSDGGEVAQCGNGARCFAKFVREKNLSSKSWIRVETLRAVLSLEFASDDEVEVDMGIPVHSPNEIPLQMPEAAPSYRLDLDGEAIDFAAVSMGNPHLVMEVKDVARAPVEKLGPRLESHPLFPERVNVGFLEVVDAHWGKLRVFERGAGETLACGSGACAAAVTGIERGVFESPVKISLPGGDLVIRWEGRGTSVMMRGPATTVFEGEIEL